MTFNPFHLNSATVSGHAIKRVKCEQCGGRFFYRADRTAAGDHLSLLITEAAMHEAERVAEQNLEELLGRAAELVACPGCRWFQLHMIRAKRLKLAKITMLVLLASPLASIILVFGLLGKSTPSNLILSTFWYTSAEIAAAIVVIATVLALQFRPNSGRFFPFSRKFVDTGKMSTKPEEAHSNG